MTQAARQHGAGRGRPPLRRDRSRRRRLGNTLCVTIEHTLLAKDGETIKVGRDGVSPTRIPIHGIDGVVAFGLPSRIVAVAGEADLDEAYNTERHLMYVACTGARDRLLVTGVAPGSEFIGDLGR